MAAESTGLIKTAAKSGALSNRGTRAKTSVPFSQESSVPRASSVAGRGARREEIADGHAHLVVRRRLSHRYRSWAGVRVGAAVTERVPSLHGQEVGSIPQANVGVLPVRRVDDVLRL